jgi:DNA repair protein RadC
VKKTHGGARGRAARRRRTATQIAEALELYDLARAALPAAARADLNDLVWRCDAPPEVAALRRALEIALRPPERTLIRNAGDASAWLLAYYAGRAQEEVVVLSLTVKHAIIRHDVAAVGSVSSANPTVADLFRPAIRCGAGAMIVAHNHPSGDPTPSPEDVAFTRRLREAGRVMGIDVVDHLVVGAGEVVSLRERMSAW